VNYRALTFLVILAAAAAAGTLSYRMASEPALRAAAREGDPMLWLRAEFRLNDGQFAAIKKLHDDYSMVCSQHCAAIVDARERKAPPAEVAALEKACVDAMTVHFRQVAALMPAGEGDRYLATVLPRVAGYSHAGAPNVRATP
jgi:hypothetical protein